MLDGAIIGGNLAGGAGEGTGAEIGERGVEEVYDAGVFAEDGIEPPGVDEFADGIGRAEAEVREAAVGGGFLVGEGRRRGEVVDMARAIGEAGDTVSGAGEAGAIGNHWEKTRKTAEDLEDAGDGEDSEEGEAQAARAGRRGAGLGWRRLAASRSRALSRWPRE